MAALGDVIIKSLIGLLHRLFSPITDVIEEKGPEIIDVVVSTPYPNAVFTRPSNDAWPGIYDYYWGTLIPLSLFLWAVMVSIVIFLESTSHLFSGYHRSKMKRRAVSGMLGLLTWWWVAALSLQFTDALTGFLVPSLANISLFETLSFGTMGVLGLVISLTVDLVLFVLIALIYFVRQVALYLFVLMMPILIVFWIPGVGPFALVARFMKQLAGFYAPFLFMTVPVALLFRLGELLGAGFGFSMSGIGAWLIALVIPVVAVLSPLVLFWQAGALLFMGDRVARHVSREHARGRTATARRQGEAARHGTGNLRRGLRGEGPIRRDGQYLIDPSASRAHATGSRIRAASVDLRDAFSEQRRGAPKGGTTLTAPPTPDSEFETLRRRDRPRWRAKSPGRVDDSRPPYID